MNKDLFMKIVFSVREYDDYFMIKQRLYMFLGLHLNPEVHSAMCCLACPSSSRYSQ
jgi:hypothetical protein